VRINNNTQKLSYLRAWALLIREATCFGIEDLATTSDFLTSFLSPDFLARSAACCCARLKSSVWRCLRSSKDKPTNALKTLVVFLTNFLVSCLSTATFLFARRHDLVQRKVCARLRLWYCAVDLWFAKIKRRPSRRAKREPWPG